MLPAEETAAPQQLVAGNVADVTRIASVGMKVPRSRNAHLP